MTAEDVVALKEEIALANPAECHAGCGRPILAKGVRVGLYFDGYIYISESFARDATRTEMAAVLSHEMAHARGILDERGADEAGVSMAMRAGFLAQELRLAAKRIRGNLWRILF